MVMRLTRFCRRTLGLTALRPVLALAAAGLVAPLLSGCVTSTSANPTTGLYVRPIGDAPVTADDTPYSRPLVCLARYAQTNNLASPRLAVGRIADLTGATTQVTGTQLTQGASLFAMTALGKAGARLVERYDTAVPEIELKYAMGKLLSDHPDRAGSDDQNFRRVFIGQVAGSDYYVVGAVTELNSNLASPGLSASGGKTTVTGVKATLTAQRYVMNIAMDIRLVNTRSQEVVDMVSYQKQIVGRQVSAGVFDFFGGSILDLSGGDAAMEPAHLAVRTLVERAMFEFMANFYGLRDPRVCLPASADVLARAPA